MPAPSVDEIIIGTGTLYHDLLTGGEVFPANPTVAPAAGWTETGYTDEGAAVELDRTHEDVEVAELFDPVAIMKTKQSFKVVVALAQTSLENFVVAWGGTLTPNTPVGFDTWVPDTTTQEAEAQLLFRAIAPTIATVSKLRDWQFPRVKATGASTISHAKAPAKQLLAVEFRVIKPAAGDIVTVIDEK